MSVKTHIDRDNNLRVSRYRKDATIERRLFEMNVALSHLECEPESDIDYPTIFVFGLPRSGTTLLYQLAAQCLDLGYVNNLMARFWLRPDYGIALSQAVLGPLHEANFQSDFGNTKGPHGPHEFGYFWNHWLKFESVDDLANYDRCDLKIDWSGMRHVIRGMQTMFSNGIVMKAMYAPNHMQAFVKTFTLPLFVYVDRDPSDVALSLLSARKAYYGHADAWWSYYPPNYKELQNCTFDKQIAGQVHSLRETHYRVMQVIPADLIIKVDYRCICERPSDVIERIRERAQEVHGVDIGTRLATPHSFSFRTRPEDLDDEQKAVLVALSECST